MSTGRFTAQRGREPETHTLGYDIDKITVATHWNSGDGHAVIVWYWPSAWAGHDAPSSCCRWFWIGH